jgi:hypothetical protein
VTAQKEYERAKIYVKKQRLLARCVNGGAKKIRIWGGDKKL